jgi:hypothetical protein
MTPDRERPAESVETPVERQLLSCLRRLLNTTELNMDDMEEETHEAIQEAMGVLEHVSIRDNGT